MRFRYGIGGPRPSVRVDPIRFDGVSTLLFLFFDLLLLSFLSLLELAPLSDSERGDGGAQRFPINGREPALANREGAAASRWQVGSEARRTARIGAAHGPPTAAGWTGACVSGGPAGRT